jgi:DNA repair protein RecN (Recombination protein N)
MLKTLRITNYALIDRLELEFGPGLTIITGETGAGKSIMLGALSLLLGGRADTRVIGDSSRKSEVEAIFVDVDPELRPVFDERGIEWVDADSDGRDGNEVIIRREISASGRSKVYINDRSVTLLTLSLVASRLIDIHSQHANAKLSDPAEQLRVVDLLSDNKAQLAEYRKEFAAYVDIRRRLKALREEMSKSAENADFMKFQLEQLDKLKPRRGELVETERRFEVLSDADEIRDRLRTMGAMLGTGDSGALTLISEAGAEAGKVDFSLFGKEAENADIPRRLASLSVELKDIYETVCDMAEEVDSDPAGLARLSARMNSYYEAVKNFRVKEADELVDLRDELRRKLSDIGGEGTELPQLEELSRLAARRLKRVAAALTESRTVGAERLSRLITETARPLGLSNLTFQARLSTAKLGPAGQDYMEFLCSFNKNGRMQPLADVASGGEVSRMMLSLKAILAGKMNLPTIIFDEVDTGVSGEIADKMGAMMRDMGVDMQVLVITHLPQVAAKGNAHFKVFKHDDESRTFTNVKRLSDDERVREIASMLSGSEVTGSALAAARDLMKP